MLTRVYISFLGWQQMPTYLMAWSNRKLKCWCAMLSCHLWCWHPSWPSAYWRLCIWSSFLLKLQKIAQLLGGPATHMADLDWISASWLAYPAALLGPFKSEAVHEKHVFPSPSRTLLLKKVNNRYVLSWFQRPQPLARSLWRPWAGFLPGLFHWLSWLMAQ